MIKPRKLEIGDTIALISPSSNLANLFPHRVERAKNFLEEMGFKVKLFPYQKFPRKKAKQIIECFKNKEIKAIICTIGGETANQTLKYLDFSIIRANPKIFCGYSDISVLHYAILSQAGLTTFYGPCAMTQLGEYPKPINYTIEYFRKAVMEGYIGKVKPSDKWTDEVLDWSKKEDLKRERKMEINRGFEWIKKGKAEGKIIGGCLPSIMHLRGTMFWPSHKNKILFLETSESYNIVDGQSIEEVSVYLTDLELNGIFEEIKGLIMGRPYGYSKEQRKIFKELLNDFFENYTFPILYGVDIGHTDPQITIPLNVKVKIDSDGDLFEIIEKGIENNL